MEMVVKWCAIERAWSFDAVTVGCGEWVPDLKP